jgi:hypothetical protein
MRLLVDELVQCGAITEEGRKTTSILRGCQESICNNSISNDCCIMRVFLCGMWTLDGIRAITENFSVTLIPVTRMLAGITISSASYCEAVKGKSHGRAALKAAY